MIGFALTEQASVGLAVYNLGGQKTAILLDGERAVGVYSLQWPGRDDAGRAPASVVYLYRLRPG